MDDVMGWIIVGLIIMPYALKILIAFLSLFVPQQQEQNTALDYTITGPQPLSRAEVLERREEACEQKARGKKYFETKIRPTLNQNIGTDTAKCPYCGMVLVKMPVRASKCKACNNKFVVRTRPYDEAKILCTEKDLKLLAKEREKIDFMIELGDEYFKYERKLQQVRNTDKIPPRDVMWNKISTDIYNAQVKQDTSKLSQSLWKSGHFLIKDKKYSQALEDLLMFQYYRAIPVDIEHINGTTRETYVTPTDPWVSLIGDTARCVLYLGLSKSELVDFFVSIRPPIQTGVPLSVFVPNLKKAYDELMQDKKEYEEEFQQPYLGVESKDK